MDKLAENIYKLSAILILGVILIGVCGLLGWQFDILIFKSGLPDLVAINPLTAILLIVCGISLFFLRDPELSQTKNIIGKSLALIVFIIGILKVSAIFGFEFNLDKIIYQNQIGTNQMATNTGIGFIFSGLAICLLGNKNSKIKSTKASQVFSLLVLCLSLLVIAGYINRSVAFIQTGGTFPMALNTTFAFFLLSFAILFSRPRDGVCAVVFSHSAGGIMSRKMIPFVVLLPIAIGWIRVKGEYLGFYDLHFGTALFVTLIVGMFLFLIWRVAKSLNRIDEAFQRQTAMIHSILEGVGDGVVVADANEKLILFNPAAEKLLGLGAISDPSENWGAAYGVFKDDMKTPYPNDELPLIRAVRGKETNQVTLFIRNAKKPGGVFLSMTGRTLLNDSDGIAAGVVTFRDITEDILERKRVYEITTELKAQNVELYTRSHSAAKMASLGEMAAGVGHEINNPLTAIIGGIDELLERFKEKNTDIPSIVAILKSIKATSLRIAKIVRSLKSFSRDGSKDPYEVSSLRKIFDETAELCREKIRYKDIDFRIDRIRENLFIDCRQVEISQALLNLISNAQDAIKDLSEKWIHISIFEEKDFVEISITDSGKGISSEVQEKLFQPFFTTKEIGKGTGLGLSISREMIERHGGRLELDTTSVNTRFIIRIPYAKEKKNYG